MSRGLKLFGVKVIGDNNVYLVIRNILLDAGIIANSMYIFGISVLHSFIDMISSNLEVIHYISAYNQKIKIVRQSPYRKRSACIPSKTQHSASSESGLRRATS